VDVSCGGREKYSVYENGCKLNLIEWGGAGYYAAISM